MHGWVDGCASVVTLLVVCTHLCALLTDRHPTYTYPCTPAVSHGNGALLLSPHYCAWVRHRLLAHAAALHGGGALALTPTQHADVLLAALQGGAQPQQFHYFLAATSGGCASAVCARVCVSPGGEGGGGAQPHQFHYFLGATSGARAGGGGGGREGGSWRAGWRATITRC